MESEYVSGISCRAGQARAQKKRPRNSGAASAYVDAAVVLLCCAIRSFLVRSPFGVLPCPVPTTLLVSGYLRRNVTKKFRVSPSRPSGSFVPLSLPVFPGGSAFRVRRPRHWQRLGPPLAGRSSTSELVNAEAIASASNLFRTRKMSTISDVSFQRD